jgi:hypothetical protein
MVFAVYTQKWGWGEGGKGNFADIMVFARTSKGFAVGIAV